MGYPIKQSSTAQPLVFLMVDSTDHVTGKAGLSPTVTLSKAGGSFAGPAGAVTEIANGWYKVAGNATDSGTLGPLVLHATGTGADPTDDRFDVVAYDPQATSLGLVLAKTTNLTGLNDIAATAIVSSGAINTSGGAVSTVTNLTNLPAAPTDWLSAAAVSAAAAVKIEDAVWAGAPAGTPLEDIATAVWDAAPASTPLSDIKDLVVEALATDTYAEPGAAPAATSTLKDKINWLFALARNKTTNNGTTIALRNDADSGNIATAGVSESGGTFTRNEFS